ncbi:MAG: hypothetical protein Q8933_08480 [Bacteroidota bacterium]|nr:hypothetical protein [Bacteroidota bacterium]
MLFSYRIFAQNSLDLTGNLANSKNSQFNLNGLESNRSAFSSIKDWEFSVTYGGEFANSFNGNLYLLSLSKRLNDNYFYIRYSPGYFKDFTFNTGTNINFGDTLAVELKSLFHYEELFGFGYSRPLSKTLSAGFSFRYFKQQFSNDQASLKYNNNSTSIVVNTKSESDNFWIGDLGLNYYPASFLNLSFSTINLIKAEASVVSEENLPYKMKMDRSLLLGLNYQMTNNFNAKLYYEFNRSFQASVNTGFDLLGGNLNLSLGAFHDIDQAPYIAGIVPGINYSTGLFSVSLTGVKYFSDRTNQVHPITEFREKGLHNILNNSYSFDKAVLSVNFALNTIDEKILKFVDVNVIQDIFPTLADKYLESPFAVAKVINLSDKTVSVKPYCRISGINNDKVQSPSFTIAPKDTAEIPFYTIIDQSARINRKMGISQADFYVSSGNDSQMDDEFHKPVLVNDVNSWDGKVSDLKYFVWHDLDRSLVTAKNIIQLHKQQLDSLPSALSKFYITSILFEKYVSQMVYVSDPRASVNRVQFPSETLSLKGGACDDLSVGFSSLLESVGIQTAFVDFKSDSSISHVNLLVNTELSPDQARLITGNDKKYVLRKDQSGNDEVWIPLEMTSLTDFNKAWETAAEKFNSEAIEKMGLAKGTVEIVDLY